MGRGVGDASYLMELHCKHRMHFSTAKPASGDQVYCRSCQAYRLVVRHIRALMVKCRDCTYSANHGEDSLGAERAASRHVMKKPEHRVDLTVDGVVVQTVAQDAGQGVLPFATAVQERQAANRDHQGSLKTFHARPVNPLT